MNESPILLVIFDDKCALCRSLAAFAQERSGEGMDFMAWSAFRALPEAQDLELPQDDQLTRLQVLQGETLHQGPEAWRLVLRHYPDLKGLSWLAKKLGLEGVTAEAMEQSGRAARLFCGSCGGLVNRMRRRRIAR